MLSEVASAPRIFTSLDLGGVVASLLVETLEVLAADEERLATMFTVPHDGDTETRRDRWLQIAHELLGGVQAPTPKQRRRKNPVPAAEGAHLSIGVGLPATDQPMPYLAVVMGASSEAAEHNESGLVLGSRLSAPASIYKPGTREYDLGRAYRSTVFVQVWEPLQERAAIAAALVRGVLSAWLPLAARWGLLEASLSDTGFEPAEEWRGRVPFVHAITLAALHFVGDTVAVPTRRYISTTGTFY